MSRMTEGIRDEIVDFAKQELAFWKVPGAAVAVVEGGEITVCEGFGVRDLEAGQPVNPQTAFRLASVSKTFVALTAAIAVDEGLMEWDKPLKHYIPDFKMYDDVLTQRLTIRDTLCHRSGMPGHNYALHEEMTRGDYVHRLRYLENSYDLRVQLQYSSQMVVLAAYAVECVTGMRWEDFAKKRILEPLGMDNTFLSLYRAWKNGNLTQHYYLDGDARRKEKVSFSDDYDPENYWAGNPAGGLSSSAEDLAKFLSLHLCGGEYRGRRIVSEKNLHEVLRPNMVDQWNDFQEKLNPCAALGWFTYAYRDARHVSMAGYFGGQIFLIPEKNLGIVFLQSMATVAGDSIPLFSIDRLLGYPETDWHTKVIDVQARRGQRMAAEGPGKAEANPAVAGRFPLEAYAGVYEHPAYGAVEIALRDGKLGYVDWGKFVPLEYMGEETFDAGDTTFTFRAENGSVMAVAAPLEPTVSPIVFKRT